MLGVITASPLFETLWQAKTRCKRIHGLFSQDLSHDLRILTVGFLSGQW